jgi:hypothetical protein
MIRPAGKDVVHVRTSDSVAPQISVGRALVALVGAASLAGAMVYGASVVVGHFGA